MTVRTNEGDGMTEETSQGKLLAAEFEETFTDNRGGISLTYITGEQVISRLNEVLGVGGWDFEISEHGVNEQADEVWVLASIRATVDGRLVTREQFGSQKIARRRNDSSVIDFGFNLKSAGTDALKKCANLLGVGLYLSKRDPNAAPQYNQNGGGGSQAPTPAAASLPSNGSGCFICGKPLEETRFRDGTVWTPEKLAEFGKRKHGQALCMEDYRGANDRVKNGQPGIPVPAAGGSGDGVEELPF